MSTAITTTPDISQRFTFLGEALNGSGGFAPRVYFDTDSAGMRKPTRLTTDCHLVPYPRENAQKYAARAAVAVYENHLRGACEHFTGYLARRKPQRDTGGNPLFDRMVQDADWSGNHLDVFWQDFTLHAKARGSMLLLIELPREQGANQRDAISRRLVPYLTAIAPERLCSYALNEQKRFDWVRLSATHDIGGKATAVERYWDAQEWRVYLGDMVIDQGAHPFGECPLLAFTEGGAYPCIGEFAQVADLSKRIYNARSELDEILRGQTFSVLAYQIPSDRASSFSAAQVSATIGTNNMLVHEGATPSFIAPPDGPATMYQQVIEGLHDSIRKISHSTQASAAGRVNESGLALMVRFQALNGSLSRFARRMQDLELRMWDIVAHAMNSVTAPIAQWATDYSLTDLQRELDVLAAMQATGFPTVALVQQRKRIASEAFDAMDETEIIDVLAAIEEAGQEIQGTGQIEP